MLASGRHRSSDGGGHSSTYSRPTGPNRAAAITERPRRFSRATAVTGLATAAALALAASASTAVTGTFVGMPAPPTAVFAAGPVGEVGSAAVPAEPPPVATAVAPLRATTVGITAIGVRSDLIELGIDGAGALEVPPTAAVAGWFTGGAVPGEPGPTVIAGHVDSRLGPGVFARLGELTVGAQVEVGRSDGTTVRYQVVDVLKVAKDAFPTDRVYGPTPGVELRLITCGGDFDRRSGHYVDNVVVSAVLVDPT